LVALSAYADWFENMVSHDVLTLPSGVKTYSNAGFELPMIVYTVLPCESFMRVGAQLESFAFAA
jgi:hypothetical protein